MGKEDSKRWDDLLLLFDLLPSPPKKNIFHKISNQFTQKKEVKRQQTERDKSQLIKAPE